MNIFQISRSEAHFLSDELLEALSAEGFGAGKKDETSYILRTDANLVGGGNREHILFNQLMYQCRARGYDTLILTFKQHNDEHVEQRTDEGIQLEVESMVQDEGNILHREEKEGCERSNEENGGSGIIGSDRSNDV